MLRPSPRTSCSPPGSLNREGAHLHTRHPRSTSDFYLPAYSSPTPQRATVGSLEPEAWLPPSSTMSTSVHLMSEPEALRAKVTSDWSCPAASPARGPGREHTLQQEGRAGPCTPSAWAGLLHSVSQRPSHGDQSYGQSALKAGGRGRQWSDNMWVAKCSPTKVPTPRKSLSLAVGPWRAARRPGLAATASPLQGSGNR